MILGSACDAKQAKQEWDGLTRYFDAAMSRFFKVDNHQVCVIGLTLKTLYVLCTNENACTLISVAQFLINTVCTSFACPIS